jgi:hypothetical protein
VPDWSLSVQVDPLAQDNLFFRTALPEDARKFDLCDENDCLLVYSHHVDTIVKSAIVCRDDGVGVTLLSLLDKCRGNSYLEEAMWRTLIRRSDQKAISQSELAIATSILRKYKGRLEEPRRLPWFSDGLSSVLGYGEESPAALEKCRALLDQASASWAEYPRSICTTERGRIVLGPSEARPGDGVYIIGGSDAPLILRQQKYTLAVRFIGDSYVYGLAEEMSQSGTALDIKPLIIR